MPSNFSTKLIATVSGGRTKYSIKVIHLAAYVFDGNPADRINYHSLDGLSLKFRRILPGSNSTNVTSTFALGITGTTFSGVGKFNLQIIHSSPGNEEEIDTVAITRSGGGAPNPDAKDLVAIYLGSAI